MTTQAAGFLEDPARASIQNMISGFRVSQMISVAAKLRLADHLTEGPKTAAQLARATGAHEDSLYRLLRALAGLGIFAEENETRFRLSPSAEFLRSDVPGSLKTAAEVVGEEWTWLPWGSLLHTVMTGETAFDRVYGKNTWDWFTENPAAARLFDELMDEITAAHAKAVVEAFDFTMARTVVDIAGGRGALLEAILRRNVSARGILFNLAPVIDSARKVLDSEITRRIDFVSGDFFQGVPSGGDAYILKNILHDWDDDRAREILAICRRAMAPNAVLLIVETIVRSPNELCEGKIGDLQMMVRTGGRNRTEKEFRDLLAPSGFQLSRIVQMRGGPDLLEASLQP